MKHEESLSVCIGKLFRSELNVGIPQKRKQEGSSKQTWSLTATLALQI